jgi:hypothetical protein
MYRIDNADATSTLPTPLAPGPVPHGFFQSGNPSTGQKATTVDRDWANTQQEEIANVVEAAGITLSKTNNAQLLAALRSLFVTRTKVTTNMTIYVNPTTGNDANNGLTAGAPFRTIQAAINAVYSSYDWNSHGCTIQLADGTYNYAVTNGYAAGFNGIPFGMQGIFTLMGNIGSPGNVIINATNANCLSMLNVPLSVRGITFQATGNVLTPSSVQGYGASVGSGANLDIQSCRFGSCGSVQVNVFTGGIAEVTGSAVTFTGSTPYALFASNGGYIWMPGATVTVTGLALTGGFIVAGECGTIDAGGCTFVGSATGPRYVATLNGVINTNGGGANYFPGDAVGSVGLGGQYV